MIDTSGMLNAVREAEEMLANDCNNAKLREVCLRLCDAFRALDVAAWEEYMGDDL